MIREAENKFNTAKTVGGMSVPRIWTGVRSEDLKTALLRHVPNEFDVSKVTRKGMPKVYPTNVGLASMLGHCVTPHLNSHSILKELNELTKDGLIRNLRCKVEKFDPDSGKTSYHYAKIYAKTEARTPTRVYRGRRTLTQTLLDILPTDVLAESNGMIPGTSEWCANKLGIDTGNKARYGVLRGTLSHLHKKGTILAANSESPRSVPRIYYKR